MNLRTAHARTRTKHIQSKQSFRTFDFEQYYNSLEIYNVGDTFGIYKLFENVYIRPGCLHRHTTLK